MDAFPRGACGDSALMLGQYLFESGLGKWQYRSGMRDGYTHAWIDQDGLIVDITADQFDEISEPVIVARRSAWYQTFTSIGGEGRQALVDDPETDGGRMQRLYVKVLSVL
jgi:hypothetical protein